MSKKIKVRMTSKKSGFGYGSHVYRPGDVFEVEEKHFRADFMVKVEEPKKPKKPPKEEETVVEEVVQEALPTETPVEETVAETEPEETVEKPLSTAAKLATAKVQKRKKR